MSERLYSLLPAHLRRQDQAQGGPLRALLALMQSELDRVEDATWAQHLASFVETCDEATLPLLGELVGLDLTTMALPFSRRARVADATRLRARRGTPAALEQALSAASGWRARVLEYPAQLASWHSRLPHPAAPPSLASVRDVAAMDRVGGPFDACAHLPDLRVPVADRPGAAPRWGTGRVGVFLWRQAVAALDDATLRPAASAPGGFHVDPHRRDTPLFTAAGPLPDLDGRVGPEAVPGRLTRGVLARDLREAGQLIGPEGSLSLRLLQDGAWRSLTSGELAARDLSDWARPSGDTLAYVDPDLGRICVAEGFEAVRARFVCATPGELGAAPRPPRLQSLDEDVLLIELTEDSSSLSEQLERAEQALAEAPERAVCLRLHGARLHTLSRPLTLPPGAELRLEAATLARPVLLDGLELRATDPSGPPPRLTLWGLSLAAPLVLAHAAQTTLTRCTLWPDAGASLRSDPAGQVGTLHLRRCLIRQLDSALELAAFSLEDCLVAGDLDAPGLSASLQRCTVLGATRLARMPLAEDCVFRGEVQVEDRSRGAVRFCALPESALTPPRSRCQPEQALLSLQQAGAPPEDLEAARLRLALRFEALSPSAPAFGQLSPACAAELRFGASDGGELGAFHHLATAWRSRAVTETLAEHLPPGVTADLLYAT
ncbi:MAG: hypothetical protein H6741_19745 [Alphaproteobacteria bacterium]|nr:hypothetical protein [Alphaproteobacteria bacterium]MCB9794939.1 hypothetical protein [Alphaproteobacteria bacterium]